MPAFQDRFEFSALGGATVFERDPYTWSGYQSADRDGEVSQPEVTIGGNFYAAFINFDPNGVRAGDDYYANGVSGLRIVSAEIGAGRRRDYNVNSAYAGNVYALSAYVQPDIAWWANLNAKLSKSSMCSIAAPTGTTSSYVWTSIFAGEEGESAEDVLNALANGLVIRASFGSVIEVNKRTYYTLYGGNIMRLYIDMASVPITIGEMSPVNGGYISPTTGGTLTWTLAYDPTNVYGVVKQASAKVQIRTGEDDPGTEYAVPDGTMSFTVTPEMATQNFQWRVQASTEWYEDSPWSDWMQVSVVDSMSTPEPLSPVNQIIEGNTDVVFSWRHVISTGTAQTGWEIEFSTDQSLWTPLASGDGPAQQTTINISVVPAGSVYWHVRTKNADGVAGNWSTPALIVIRDAPPTPVVSVSGNTRPIVFWSSSGQQGYEVRVDGVSTGVRYGVQTQYQWEDILADGAHSIGVRVINQFGLYSPWGAATHTVLNVPLDPGPTLQAIVERNALDVDLYWTGVVDTFAEIWRDDVRIATTDAPGQYVDHTATGRHVYRVRIVDTDGNYSDSPQAVVDLPIKDAAISVDGVWQWVRLADGSGGSLPTISASYAPLYTLNHYSGRVYPVAEVSIQRTATYNVSYELEDASDVAAVRAMIGHTVVHKQRGQLLRGFLESVQETQNWWGSEVSLQITEVSE